MTIYNFDVFRSGWDSSKETPCGYGSELQYTAGLRDKLPHIIEELRFSLFGGKEVITINDAGCGDQHWIGRVDFTDCVDYRGYDLYPRNSDVIQLDITSETMRDCDIIFCRDVFIHFPNQLICSALEQFRKTGKYLIATTFPDSLNYIRHDKITMHHQKLDMAYGPFYLGKPISLLPEPYEGKFLGVWKI